MTVQYYPFDSAFRFGALDIHYAVHPEEWAADIAFLPTVEGILAAARQRKDSFPVDRQQLVSALNTQYESLGEIASVKATIASLESENTMAVVTAHQPVLMGGPLYTVYKILSAVKLCQQLNAAGSEFSFVPVFVMGSEDHDKEEINHFYHYGKKIAWETEQEGAIGRFMTEGLETILATLQERNASSEVAAAFCRESMDILRQASHYRGFYQQWLHSLFGSYGLVVLDMDVPSFKQSFVPWLLKEVDEHFTLKTVSVAQEQKRAKGYKPATFLRPVNFFILDAHGRHKIEVLDDGRYQIGEQGAIWTRTALRQFVLDHPEQVSPNVNLRPLYQECIVPNVAYIGGGGEISYWLERKVQFEAAKVFFPALVRRDSLWWIDATTCKKMKRIGAGFSEFSKPQDTFIREYVLEHAGHEVTLDAFQEKLEQLFQEVRSVATSVDATLAGVVEAEKVKAQKSLEMIQHKMLKAEKASQDSAVASIHAIYDKLFPGGDSIQERHDNFLGYYFRLGPAYFDSLLEVLDPLRRELKVILEDDVL
jgi:bacillithiol biosynthesis cysteine-adding enzyme BshC